MKPSEDAIDAWRSMLQVHQQLTTRMDMNLRERHQLRLDWYDVLYQLTVAGGRMRMHELAAVTLFSRTDCTRIVDRMERAGLVERERAEEDRRGVYAVLTAGGGALFRNAARSHLDDIERLFGAHLIGREARVLAAALERVLAAGDERAAGGQAEASAPPATLPVSSMSTPSARSRGSCVER